MRKALVYVVLALTLVSGLALLAVGNVKATASTVDQYCTNSDLGLQVSIIRNGADNRQAFVPTQNRINNIAIKVSGNGSTGVATLRVYTSPSGTDSQILRSDRNFSNLNSPVVWYFNDFGDVTLTPGTTYYISLVSSDSVRDLYWYKVATGGCTAPGMAFLNGTQQGYKLDFATFGFIYTPPAQGEATPPTSTDTTTTEGAAPSENVSSSIAKPTGLLAAYSSETAKKGVNLFWKASTTADITGYNIYRSIVKGKSYSKIGQVDKTKLEFVDPAAEASKTYYYVVRAYKGEEESASSNEASLLVPADAAPIAPLNFKVDSFTDSKIKVSWDKSPEANITSYNLTIMQGDEQIETATVTADTLERVFSDLTANNEYKISVIASNGTAVSAPSELTQKTAAAVIESKASDFEMTTLIWILSGLGVALIGALILLIIRRRRLAKKFR